MELPDDIMHVQNMIIANGNAKRNQHYRNLFSGPRLTSNTGLIIHFVWDVTDYTPHGKNARILDDINHMVDIADWERLPNANHIDMNYAKDICIPQSKPALIVRFKDPNGNEHQIIADGNHRIAKANMIGMKTYPAHMLTVEESEKCRLPEEISKKVWGK